MSQVTMNQLILLSIKRIGINGEGVGFYKRQAVFVEGALPGEVVEVEITKIQQNFAYGVIKKFKKKSPHRTEPKCDHFTNCRCSDLQHLDYKEQLVHKENLLNTSLQRYYDGAPEEIPILPIKAAKKKWQMRTYLHLATRHDGGRVVVGMYERGSNRLVYIDKCFIFDQLLQEKLEQVLDELTKKNISVFNPRYQQGSLRSIMLKVCPYTKESMLIAVLYEMDKQLINVLKGLKFITSIYYTINDDPKSSIINNNLLTYIAGSKTITIKSNDLEFQILPQAFYFGDYEDILDYLLEMGKDTLFAKTKVVASLFSSLGIIGTVVSPFVKKVLEIEEESAVSKNTTLNVQTEKTGKIQVLLGDVTKKLEEAIAKENIDTLIVSAPRSGIDLRLIRLLQKKKIRNIIYISSNPSTFSKNMNHLQKQYIIKSVQPIDVAPQTINFAIICHLQAR